MQIGDRVYFRHTNKAGVEVRYPALVLGIDGARVQIRFGRFNAHSREVDTYRHSVGADVLQPRGAPCAFEEQLRGAAG